MRILLVASAYNGLCQRAYIELALRGHEVSVELFIDEEAVREGIALFKPDLVICPFLKQRIPDDICNSILKFLSLDKALDASVGPSRSCSSFVFERW